MKAVVAVLFVCSLVHSGYAAVILAPYQEANCTQIEVHGNNLQEVLINVSLTEPSDACFQVAIVPGNYTISQVLIISQNVALQGVGRDVNVAFNRAEVSLTFHSLSFVIRLTLEVLTFAQAAECIHKSYDVSAERIIHVLQFSMV